MLFDTHAHLLAEQFDDDREQLIQRLAGEVSLVLEAGTDEADSARALALAEQYGFIYSAAGVHPHEAAAAGDGYLDVLRRLLARPKCVAVGEIGLDYHYDFSPRERQKEVFAAQLDLAAELDMPVIIHDREAHADVLDMIRARKGRVRGVMHCYSGSMESAREYIKLGFYISFAGPITFKNAGKLPGIAANLPSDRILAETDSPYLAPVPHRGQRNDPGKVRHVVQRIAEARGIAFEDAAALTMANGKTLFGIRE